MIIDALDGNRQPVVRLHLWLETENGIFFGLGRLKLLEQIQAGKSLSGAAKAMGMSYRAAWGKVRKTEQVLGVALIEKKAGNKAGYQITEAGSQLVVCFRRWFREVEAYALSRAKELLPCDPIAFEEPSDADPSHV
ncbi:winged helix-turn-helix domain-containing protein [Desulfatitalea tepidiphila]|uniref:winged helix-turn-helix domain-containing protein n=1 Tax=Desulfatitalea tepidiphila TaxID=1185843 RepID=UPI0006B613AF|nr:LysR family transcriptional regulator [Desulfatitalea tepidiphila]